MDRATVLVVARPHFTSHYPLDQPSLCEPLRHDGQTMAAEPSAHGRGHSPSEARRTPRKRKACSVAENKEKWTEEEDKLLTSLVGDLEPKDKKEWSTLLPSFPGRIGKQLRERWENHLRPGINFGPWTEPEELAFVKAHMQLGNRWAQIARLLPGRTENGVKNHWHATLRKTMRNEGSAAQGKGASTVLHEYQRASGARQRSEASLHSRRQAGRTKGSPGSSSDSEQASAGCPSICTAPHRRSPHRPKRRASSVIISQELDTGCEASGSDDAGVGGPRRTRQVRCRRHHARGTHNQWPACSPLASGTDERLVHDGDSRTESLDHPVAGLDLDLDSMGYDLGLDAMLAPCDADKALQPPLLLPAEADYQALTAIPQLDGDSNSSEYLCFLEAPEDTHGDQSTLGSMLWQQDGAATLAAAKSGPSMPVNAWQGQGSCRVGPSAGSLRLRDADLCSFALRSSSSELHVPLGGLQIETSSAVRTRGRFEGASRGGLVPCTAPAATQQDGCKAPTARQMQSSSAGSASSASTCWAAAWSSDVPLDAPVSRPGIVLAPPKECITVSARPLQALDFYIRCLSSPTSHVANFAGKGPALPFAECQDLHTQLKVRKALENVCRIVRSSHNCPQQALGDIVIALCVSPFLFSPKEATLVVAVAASQPSQAHGAVAQAVELIQRLRV